MSRGLSHLDERGRARMVDVGEKPVTERECVARGEVRLTPKKAGDQVEWACTSSQEIRRYVPVSCR